MHALAAAVAIDLEVDVRAATRLSGGDVAESYRLELADGRTVFAKTHRNPPAGFFTTEASGLRWLREPEVVAVPEVLDIARLRCQSQCHWWDVAWHQELETTEQEWFSVK